MGDVISAWAALRWPVIEGFRSRWCGARAARPGRQGLALRTRLAGLVVLLLVNGGAWLAGTALASRIRSGAWPRSEAEAFLSALALLVLLGLAATTAFSACYTALQSDERLRAWPLPPELLCWPELALNLVDGLEAAAFSLLPLILLTVRALDLPGAWLVAALAGTGLILLCAASAATLLFALVLRLAPGRRQAPEFLFAALSVVAAAGLFALLRGVSFGGAAVWSVLAGRLSLMPGLNAWAPLWLHPKLPLAAALLVPGVPLAAWLLTLASALLARTAGDRLESRLRSRSEPAFTLSWMEGSPVEIRPFLRKELQGAIREPGKILRQVLHLGVFLLLLLYVFPLRSQAVVLFVLLSVPATICSVFLLHSIGQDGDLLPLVRIASGIGNYLRAKLTIGMALVTPVSVLLALAPALGHFSGSAALLILGGAVTLSALQTVVLAVGLGSLFSDFSVKRIRPDQGVRLSGELLYWVATGVSALAIFLLTTALLTGNAPRFQLGLAVVLLVVLGTTGVFYGGKRKLETLE